MFKSSSTSLILLGILAVIVGIIAIAWPGGAAAEGPGGLQARIEERVDREQYDECVNRDARPRDGDDPDDDGENAEQDQ